MAVTGIEHFRSDETAHKEKGKTMKIFKWVAGVVMLLFLIAAFSLPEPKPEHSFESVARARDESGDLDRYSSESVRMFGEQICAGTFDGLAISERAVNALKTAAEDHLCQKN